MRDRLEPILSLLDEGLALYRRHFLRFVLIAGSWFVPMAITIGVATVAGVWLNEVWAVVLTLVIALLSMPLVVYMVGGLSRAAMAAADGQPVRVRQALAIPPRRAASMGCFTIVYSIVMQVVSSALTIVCICPLWLLSLAFIGLLGSAGGESTAGALALVVIGILFGGVYLFLLLVGGASYSSLIYAIQPWVQEQLPFGTALERAFQLVGYRFWHNLAAWSLSAALVTAAGLVAVATIGVLVPLPVLLVFGAESLAAQTAALTAWMVGLVLVLPPLPIWMTLLYRRNALARSGGDFEARVQKWSEG